MNKQDSGLRKSVFTRTAIGRGPYAAQPPYVMPRWLRRLLLGLLGLLLLLLGLTACHEDRKPVSLANSTLTGVRRTTGPVCIEEAVDVSGSMVQYTAQREQAERELFAFAKRELLPTDQISEAFFAGTARLALPPTDLQSLTAPRALSGQFGDGTLLTPAVAGLVAARASAPAPCAARALVMITDGEIYDPPPVIQAALAAADYARLYAVAPAPATYPGRGSLTGGLLDSVTVYGFHDGGTAGRIASVLGDARPLDVIFGDILADLTGQRLAKTDTTQSR
jgi:hypothetical protein